MRLNLFSVSLIDNLNWGELYMLDRLWTLKRVRLQTEMIGLLMISGEMMVNLMDAIDRNRCDQAALFPDSGVW